MAGTIEQPDRMIPITKPFFGPEEAAAVQKTLESGWVAQGPRVGTFEEKFSAFTGSRYSIATSSCTAALQVALAALRLKPGDEVIVPAFTWIATCNVVEATGARPVFCDIDPSTFNIDPARIHPLLTSRTVGIIPVHLFGLCADMDPILELANQNGLWVVEDAACALGAGYKGRSAGRSGAFGCFSFHPRKSITTGEGGMLTTGEEKLDRLARSIRNHGASPERSTEAARAFLLPEFDELGYNYRMTDIQGAIGSVQMDRLEWVLSRRSECARIYDDRLAGVDWLTLPATPPGYTHGFQAYVCMFRPEEATVDNVQALHIQRNELMLSLEDKGIATRQGTHAPVIRNYYARKYGLRPEQFPQAYIADRLSLALPLYPQMTEEEQTFVTETLKRAL
jgi:perosamine synthetase